jgi:pimeloyl-ACP methyl ester carboxylesterase
MTTMCVNEVVSSDGVRIHLVEQGRGWPILLVHGSCTDGGRWLPLMNELHHGFRVIAMDRRGRGGSTDAGTYSIDLEASDIVAVAAWIGQPFTLLGHSYGGLCALSALNRITIPHSAILYEPPISPRPRPVPELLQQLEELLRLNRREALVELFFREHLEFSGERINKLRNAPSWAGRIAAAQTIPREMRAACEHHIDEQTLMSLKAEVLLLQGAISPELVQKSTVWLGSCLSTAETIVLPGQHHMAMDTDLTGFARLVREFAQRTQWTFGDRGHNTWSQPSATAAEGGVS